jgi:hypothetical protein
MDWDILKYSSTEFHHPMIAIVDSFVFNELYRELPSLAYLYAGQPVLMIQQKLLELSVLNIYKL